jgi:hypothetical protein
MTRDWKPLVEQPGHYYECPRWHDGRWWAVDFYRYGVFAHGPGGTQERVLEVEGQPAGLGWLPDGDLLVVSMKDHRVLRRARTGASPSMRTSAGSSAATSTTCWSTGRAGPTPATSAST